MPQLSVIVEKLVIGKDDRKEGHIICNGSDDESKEGIDYCNKKDIGNGNKWVNRLV